MKYRMILLTLSAGMFFILGSICDQPPSNGPADAGLYHTYAEVEAALDSLQLAFPQLARVQVLGQSLEQRKILAIKISDSVAVEQAEPQVLFVGCHHAREWISVDLPLLLARHLLTRYHQDSRIRNLVDQGEIWIIPLLNPDGHQYSVTTDRLWRKNRRNNGDGSFGVDLNRNYSYHWGGPGSSGDTYSETFRGPSAFSEPESQALRDFANSHAIVAMISYHSFSQLVLYPWGYTAAAAPDKAVMAPMATAMADQIYQVHGKNYVPQQSADLYLASGDATDWLYGETRVPAYTIELRPASSSPGFILPESEIQPTFEENLPAALYLIEWSQRAGRLTNR